MKKTVVVFNNIKTSYRTELFENLYSILKEKKIDLQVIYLSDTEYVRKSYKANDYKNYEFILDVLYQRRNFKTTTSDFIINKNILIKFDECYAVIFMGYSYITYLVVASFALIYKVPTFVFSESTLFDATKRSSIFKYFKNILIKNLFKTCIVPGPDQYEFAISNLGYDSKDIFMAPNGVDPITNLNGLNAIEILRCDNNKITKLLYVGRLAEEKGIYTLIEAFKKLNGYELNIVGDGPELKKISSLSVSNLYIRGHLEGEELLEQYKNNDILILPSYKESWGFVINEAIRFGMAIVGSTNVGSNKILIRGNGETFEAGNIESLIAAITKVSKNIHQYKLASLKISKNITSKNQANLFFKIINSKLRLPIK